MANELVRGMMALVTGEDLSQAAAEVPFTPTGTIAATTVQTAVAEAASEAVHLTGTETITGAKTFSIAPVAPGVTSPASTNLALVSATGVAEIPATLRSASQTVQIQTGGGSGVVQLSTGAGLQPLINSYYAIYFSTTSGGVGCASAVKLKTEAADGATAVAAQSDTTAAWTDPAARLFSFRTAGAEKAAIAVGGFHPPKLAAAPAAPVEGQIYYDTTAHRLYCYDGTAWQGCW